MARRLLAAAYGGGHIAMVLPVLRELRTRIPDLQIDLLALTTARTAVAEFADCAFGYAELLERWPQPGAREAGLRLAAGNTHPAVSEAESIAYLGLNWLDLVQEAGEAEARRRYEAKARAAFYPIHTMRRLIAHYQPHAVLTTNSPRSEQALVQAAVEAGVPCLSMFDLFPVPDDPYAKRSMPADITTVIAPSAAQTLVDAGLPGSRIRVAGNPAFDALASNAAREAAAAMRERLGWQDKWVCLYAGYSEPAASAQWPAGTAFPLAVERAVREWVAARPGTALIVRQHPNHAHLFEEAWKAAGANPDVYISRPSKEAVEPCILAADVTLVQASTVGLQAAVARRPVLALEESPSIRAAGFSWTDLGVARGVMSLGELGARLDEVRTASFESTLEIPSPSAPRVADLLVGWL